MAVPSPSAAQTRPAASEPVVAMHILVSSVFLAVGSALYLLSLASVVFPDVFADAVSFGRLRPAAMSATMIGWLTISLLGGAYYLLPRLTGVALRRPQLARLTAVGLAAVAILGMVLNLVGMGDGAEPLGYPWWLDLVLLVLLTLPLIITVETVRARVEPISYVSLWFVLAGVAALPLLQAAQTLEFGSTLGTSLKGLHFAAGFNAVWVIGMGVGLAYYTIVRATDLPLANRQLTRAGFWSLMFAASWAGPLQMVYGPTPDWLDAVAAVMTLALLVGTMAHAVALGTTVAPAWESARTDPVVSATLAGAGFAVVVALLTAIGGFRSAASVVAFTPYWEGMTVGTLFGVGGLLVAGWTNQALPVVSGRRLSSPALSSRHVRLTVWGAGSAMALLTVSGIVTGLGWSGAAYTQTPAFGETWETVTGSGALLFGLATVGALVMVLGAATFVISVFSTISSGTADVTETLMSREEGT
ncbi:MAG: cbb3-type cytochrome c oxidase subunit I [Acidimicrobiia bacterium]|nr:cbb3-type cytochrome c oxidase subunit I [Acidimicrobiia bacterium]MDH4308295.1 cbb3-type cytochrome c oxidase subunit I [Acidimicrobiia bacterium]